MYRAGSVGIQEAKGMGVKRLWWKIKSMGMLVKILPRKKW
jgi:hypothetical protein